MGRDSGTAQAEWALWQPARSVWRPGFPLTAHGLAETLGCPGLHQASGDGLHRHGPAPSRSALICEIRGKKSTQLLSLC